MNIRKYLEKRAGSALRRSISIRRVPRSSGDTFQMLKDGNVIGEMLISDGNILYTSINKKYRGKGLGKKLYGEVARRLPGGKLSSGNIVSDEAERVWSSVKRRRPGSVKEFKYPPLDPNEVRRTPMPKYRLTMPEKSLISSMEKKAVTMPQLIKNMKSAPIRVKGLSDTFNPKTGVVTLTGKGAGKGSTPGAHKVNNVLTGAHEATERSTARKMNLKGSEFSTHVRPSVPIQDFIRRNRLTGVDPKDIKAGFEDVRPLRETEMYVLSELLPQYKRKLSALVKGETHLDGTRLFNRHELKKIDRDYTDLVEGIQAKIPAPRSRLDALEKRLRKRRNQVSSRQEFKEVRLKQKKLADLKRRMLARERKKSQAFDPTFLKEIQILQQGTSGVVV
tara:strand:+ start:683 stop:1855 length:1173 start_codon:yes stop_codon:yes gene_type:complete